MRRLIASQLLGRLLLLPLAAVSAIVVGGTAGAASLFFVPSGSTTTHFHLDVVASEMVAGGAPTLRSYDIEVSFDGALLAFVGASFDVHLGEPAEDAIVAASASTNLVDLASVSLLSTASLVADQPDTFRLATLHFEIIEFGLASFGFSSVLLGGASGIAVPVTEATGLTIPIPESATGIFVALGIAALTWHRLSRRRRGAVPILVVLLGVAGTLSPGGSTQANCNVIPTAIAEYPSERGRVDRPIAAPGERVAVRIDGFCQPDQPRFDPAAAANEVVLRFEPPTGVATDVAVPASSITPADCSDDGCNVLLVVIPDTDSDLAPAGDARGLAGPARILVTKDAGATPVAEIATLYEPTRACDQEPERVFERFTVLPVPNVFTSIASAGALRATLDGGNNLLIPMDYTGALRAPPGSPIFTMLEATASQVEAYMGGAPLRLPAVGAVRSFSMLGRPLPPLLRVDASGEKLFGSVDARRNVLRIQRANPGFPDFYDFSDRLFEERGPIEIPIDATNRREAAPLPSLRAGSGAVVFARDERVEGNLNTDSDALDLVPQILEPATGESRSTALAVTEVSWDEFHKPALASDGRIVAFLQSAVRQGAITAGPPVDSLRVYTADGVELTVTATRALADAEPAVAGRPLAIDDGFVFFRTWERAFAGGAEPVLLGAVSSAPAPAALSATGRWVAFESDATGVVSGDTNATWDVFLRDRDTDADDLYDEAGASSLLRASVGAGGVQANGASRRPSISPDGRWVAFDSTATNLVEPDANGAMSDVFVRDRIAGTTLRLSNDAGGVQLAAGGSAPSIGANGRFVAFASGDGSIWIVDRDSDADLLFDEYGELGAVEAEAAVAGTDVTISDDGTAIGFTSAASDLGFVKTTAHTEVYWEQRGALRRRMPTIDGFEPNGPSRAAEISANGRYVAFESEATNLAAGTPADGEPRAYVYDAQRDAIEAIADIASFFSTGEDFAMRRPRISGDGRFVVYEAPTLELVEPGDSVIVDRATRVQGLLDLWSSLFGASSAPSISDNGLDFAFRNAAGINAWRGPAASLNAPDADTRDTVLQVFDTEARELRTAARTPAALVVVAGGRAAMLSPESEDASVTNGDGDRLDRIAQVYDAHADLRTSLGVAAERIAISDEIVCVSVPEAGQPGASNGDGDDDDAVLAFWRIGQPTESLVVTPYSVDRDPAVLALGALGSDCAFLAHEADGGTTPISDGDGGSDRRLLAVYSTQTETLVTSIGLAERAQDFALGDAPGLVAFRSCETGLGGTAIDYNGDGDTDDCVMRVLDVASAPPRLIETGRAAQPCTFAACDPFFEPYRLRGVTISFLSRESEQSGPGPATPPHCLPAAVPGACDFNGDGDGDDSVIQVFNVRAETAQSFPIVESRPPDVPPFPDTSDEQTLLTIQVPESAIGEDVNGDGVIDDELVVVILGDADEDGSLDGSIGAGEPDNCRESSNATQVDVDADGLGDIVCDANLLSFGPQSLACDIDRNGQVDRLDVDLVFAARGAVAARPTDIRDPNRDGRIDVLDSGLCAEICTHANCRVTPPSGAGCGLGVELALGLAGIAALRRRTSARRSR